MQSGNRCWTEKEKKEKVLRSVMQSRCQRMVNGTALVWVRRVTENSILKSLRKFHSDGWDLREHLQRRAQQAFFCEKFISEKIISEWVHHKRQNLKRWNSEYALTESQRELESQRQHLLEASQSKVNVREYICVKDWGWSIIFIKNALQEVAEKLKNIERRFYQEEILEKKEDCRNFLRGHDQESRTVSLFFLRSWFTEQFRHTYVRRRALITSSLRKLSL